MLAILAFYHKLGAISNISLLNFKDLFKEKDDFHFTRIDKKWQWHF